MNKNFIKNVSALTLVGILVRIIGLFYRIPLTNIIGNEGNGYYGSAYNIYTMILLLSSTSIPMAISKTLAGDLFKEEDKKNIFLYMLIYAIILGFLGSSVCYLFAPILTIGNLKAIIVLRMLSPTIFFSAIMGTFRGYFQSKKNMIPTALSQLFEQIGNAIVSIGMAYILVHHSSSDKAMWGAVGAASGTLIGVIVGLIFLIIMFINKEKFKFKKIDKTQLLKIYKVLLLTMLPMILGTFIHNIGATIDMTLFYNILKVKGVTYDNLTNYYGIFSGQYLVLYHLPTALAAAISISIMPSISASKTKDELKEHLYIAFKITSFIVIPSVLGIIFLSKPLLILLFHQDEQSLNIANKLVSFGLIGAIGTSFTTISTTLLQGLNYMKEPVRNIGFAIIIQSILNSFLLYFTNLNIYSLIISGVFTSFLTVYLNFKSLNKEIVLKLIFFKAIKPSIISSFIMSIYLIIILFIKQLLKFNNYIYISISIIGGILIYCYSYIKLEKNVILLEK